MPDPVTRISDHFSLAHFQATLDGLPLPKAPFDPRGAWTNAYDMVECTSTARRHGSLVIERTPHADGSATLKVRQTKNTTGGSLHLAAEIECAADALCTPRQWTLHTETHDVTGQVVTDTRLTDAGSYRDGALLIDTGGKVRRIPAPPPLTFSWALFDAVQRLSRDASLTHAFTLVDRLNYQIKPGHTLAFRHSATVEIGGRKVYREQRQDLEVGTVFRPVASREGDVPTRLHAFEQFGEGILPIVYWTDDNGRLLLVMSGLIGYVFSPAAQA